MAVSSQQVTLFPGGGALLTGRIAIGGVDGAPPGPGTTQTRARIAHSGSGVLTSTIENRQETLWTRGTHHRLWERHPYRGTGLA
jgi:hypothetical protein